jgi:CheY-like chemotaxis protein
MVEANFDARVQSAATATDALDALRRQPFDLVLVNRVLDADGFAGLDLIKLIKADEALRRVPVMLVSNYEDSQQQAVAKGALPGFGKAGLGRQETLARLRAVLA